MAILLKEIIDEKNGTYSLANGSFFNNKKNSAFNCRETLHDVFYGSKLDNWNFYYCLNPKQTIEQIINLVSFVEDKLKIKDQISINPIKFTMPQIIGIDSGIQYTAYYFNISPFWQDIVRYNLLTYLVKYSYVLDTAKLEKLSNLPSALEKSINFFLQGNIYYLQNTFYGWISSICGPIDGIRLRLSKNQGSKLIEEACFHGGWKKYSTTLSDWTYENNQ